MVNVYLCGDDAQAKGIVSKPAQEIRLEPVDVGPLKMARYLESLAYLWVRLAFREGRGPDTTFKFLKR